MNMIEAIDKASSWLDRFQGRWSRRIDRIQDMLGAWKNELIRIEIKLGYREPKHVIDSDTASKWKIPKAEILIPTIPKTCFVSNPAPESWVSKLIRWPKS